MKPALRKEFRKSSPVDSSATYVFNYQAEVAAFHAAFPDSSDQISFVDMTPTSASVITGAFNAAAAPQRGIGEGFMAKIIGEMQPLGQSFTVRFPNGDAFVVIDRAAARRDLPRILGATATDDAENLNTFEHEVGHRLTSDLQGQNLRESGADAYAAIRHIQRFGVDQRVLDFAEMRAVELVFRPDGGNHFTSPVLDAIIAASSKQDFGAMAPKQTVAAAVAFSKACAVQPSVLAEALEEFKDLKGRLGAAASDKSVLEDLALELLTTTSATAYKWGCRALNAFLDGKVNVNGAVIQPKGGQWDGLRAEIAARAAEFPPKKSTLLRSVPK